MPTFGNEKSYVFTLKMVDGTTTFSVPTSLPLTLPQVVTRSAIAADATKHKITNTAVYFIFSVFFFAKEIIWKYSINVAQNSCFGTNWLDCVSTVFYITNLLTVIKIDDAKKISHCLIFQLIESFHFECEVCFVPLFWQNKMNTKDYVTFEEDIPLSILYDVRQCKKKDKWNEMHKCFTYA